MAGSDMGSTMDTRMRRLPAPSSSADSSIDSGMSSKKFFSRIMLYTLSIAGTNSTQMVLIRPRERISR